MDKIENNANASDNATFEYDDWNSSEGEADDENVDECGQIPEWELIGFARGC